MDSQNDGEASLADSLQHVPGAFAFTRGVEHRLVFANTAFCNLVAGAPTPLRVGHALGEAFPARDVTGLTTLLDRAYRSGVVARNRRVGAVDAQALPLRCTVWPDLRNGEPGRLFLELRASTQEELTFTIQREVAERLLLSALREQDVAETLKSSRWRAAFLASETRRLGDSLDEDTTWLAIKSTSLPYLGDWCIVDTLDSNDAMHRLATIHPDPEMQAILDELEGRWTPAAGDEFGLPAILARAKSPVQTDDARATFANAAHDPELLEMLRKLGVGSLLTVPLIIRDRLIGAITFVRGRHDQVFSAEDVALAEDLANRSASALDRARMYGLALSLKRQAEEAGQAKVAFLGMMSHELRTPLNAIGGYVDLIDMELRGPVTEEQHVDLARIKSNQRHMMALVSDLLNLAKVGSGQIAFNLTPIPVHELLTSSVALVQPLMLLKQLKLEIVQCDTGIGACGDREKVNQIIVNLLANSIKFTDIGDDVVLSCSTSEHEVYIHVTDTGIGIPADKLEIIFDPFVQVNGGTLSGDVGVGLGLAISRSLAHEMRGSLTVESTFGEGSRFTLALPRECRSPEQG